MAVAVAAAIPPPGNAQAIPDTLLVATRETPPFAMHSEDGSWEGISIALWNAIATHLGTRSAFVPMSLDSLLDAVASARVTAAAAAITITAERETRLDFSHPFYTTGLAIAAPASGGLVGAVVRALISPLFLGVTASLTLLLAAIGVLIWLLERRRNPEHFGGGAVRGIGAGFWWAAVTMTTVGYGDKAPATPLGRVLALIWMFASVITISGFTAGIATALTVQQFSGEIRGPSDLAGRLVGTVSGSTSAAYLEQRGLPPAEYPSLDDALGALAGGALDAVVYDEPILRYFVGRQHQRALTIVPGTFERQVYAIALPPGSRLREPVNRALLEVLESDAWQAVLERYLGPR